MPELHMILFIVRTFLYFFFLNNILQDFSTQGGKKQTHNRASSEG